MAESLDKLDWVPPKNLFNNRRLTQSSANFVRYASPRHADLIFFTTWEYLSRTEKLLFWKRIGMKRDFGELVCTGHKKRVIDGLQQNG